MRLSQAVDAYGVSKYIPVTDSSHLTGVINHVNQLSFRGQNNLVNLLEVFNIIKECHRKNTVVLVNDESDLLRIGSLLALSYHVFAGGVANVREPTTPPVVLDHSVVTELEGVRVVSEVQGTEFQFTEVELPGKRELLFYQYLYRFGYEQRRLAVVRD